MGYSKKSGDSGVHQTVVVGPDKLGYDLTYAVIQKEIDLISETTRKAFVIYFSHNAVAANTSEDIGHFKYTGNKQLKIEDILFESTSTNAKIEVFVDSKRDSGGTELTNEAGVYNLNRAAGVTLDVTAYDNSSDDLVVSGDTKEVVDVSVGATNSFDYEAKGLFLRNGNTISFKGEAATIGDDFRITLRCYEKELTKKGS